MKLEEILSKAKEMSHQLVMMDDSVINETLLNLADRLEGEIDRILEANQDDLHKMDSGDPLYDRVLLDEKRIKGIAASVREIASYDSPIDLLLEEKELNNGLKLKKVSVPMGVVGAIFEARPNVLIDIFALCFKSKNACVMKGGSQCSGTNVVLMEIIKGVLKHDQAEDAVMLLANDRALVNDFLKAVDYVDVIVPRGSQGLIDHVREHSLVPVIETGRGVCHTYFDEYGDLEKAKKIVFNAKVQRPSVCNSLDTLLVHRSRVEDVLPICREMSHVKVEIFADEESYGVLEGNYPEELLHQAKAENFGMEYLSLKMSVKVVADVDEAIMHINKYGSRHSEAILTGNHDNAEKFMKMVDAASVYVNASTRFTDGGMFGLGAEVGISTQKLHARGPMGIKEITSYKWLIHGDGQIRE